MRACIQMIWNLFHLNSPSNLSHFSIHDELMWCSEKVPVGSRQAFEQSSLKIRRSHANNFNSKISSLQSHRVEIDAKRLYDGMTYLEHLCFSPQRMQHADNCLYHRRSTNRKKYVLTILLNDFDSMRIRRAIELSVCLVFRTRTSHR